MLFGGRRFPKTVGSPIDKEITFLVGFGVKVIVSTTFLIGLKVFWAMADAWISLQVLKEFMFNEMGFD